MDTAMRFEFTMRLLFGKKAYHITSAEAYPASRRKWLQKAIRKLLLHVNNLDTTPRHRQMLMAELEAVLDLLKGAKDPSWELFYRLLSFSTRLLGFDYLRGGQLYTPSYWQTKGQYYTAQMLDGGDVMEDYYDKKDAISTRRAVVEELKGKGLTNFKIALVLNTTEYEIKTLHSEVTM